MFSSFRSFLILSFANLSEILSGFDGKVDTSCPSAQEEVYPGATAKSRMKVVFSGILIRFVSLQTGFVT
ncbi:MAG: hypothetical protein J0H55_01865 [Chitinophagaceae bacterium]|nr:hypothetical protein [Chitinophagaceae bacterium]